jgi:outer membrane protein assembly factor BamD
MAAELFADDPVLKMNSTRKAAEAYKKAGYKYHEFTCLQKLLVCYPETTKYKETVDRQYEIGTDFYHGERDLAIYWIPWIDDDDRTGEIYETVLKNAPFSNLAPELRLRLAKKYMAEGKIKESVEMLKSVSELFPGTPQARFAEFEIASIYMQKSARGDGDGYYCRQAVDALRELQKKYPNDPETDWIKSSLNTAEQLAAKRLYGLSEFYRRMENNDATARYLTELIRNHPETSYAPDAEKMLAEMNTEYSPAITEYKEKPPTKYAVGPMPDAVDKIIVVPENSDGKWLLPIKDLGINRKDKENDKKN